MFLTKKDNIFIYTISAAWALLGVLWFALIYEPDANGNILTSTAFLHLLWFAVAIINIPISRYSRGAAKLIRIADKLIRRDLDPESFIKIFESYMSDSLCVVKKPHFEVWRKAIEAYYYSGQLDDALDLADKLIPAVRGQKRKRIVLVKASLLYNCGRVEEADALVDAVKKGRLGLFAKTALVSVLEGNRSFAVGDFARAEDFARKTLLRIPAGYQLYALGWHMMLGKICKATKRPEEARMHLEFCVKNGGKTAYVSQALELINELAKTKMGDGQLS